MSDDTEQLVGQAARDINTHDAMVRWTHFANIALGAWLATSPFVFGDFSTHVGVLQVTAERSLPAPALRHSAIALSNIISGSLIIAFAMLSFHRRFGWARYANALVGTWLLFAPLVFWAPTPAAYANDTLIGCLVIAFAMLIPRPPGTDVRALASGPDIPPGWDYSPSDWLQRLPIIGFAALGFFIARYMTAYQLGHIPAAWDPFFGSVTEGKNGTEYIITSYVSAAWPVADAGLGALTYALEALSGAIGGRHRWRTMPWIVVLFGVLVVPLGVVSIFFIIIQPILLGTWCTLCLITAAAMVVMIPYSLDEIVATVQFLAYSYRKNCSMRALWKHFWRGGEMEGGRRAPRAEFDAGLGAILREMTSGGVNYPWTLLCCVGIGAWLMSTRLIFGTGDGMANSDHVIGALVITFTFTAFAEVARTVRLVNVPLGAWLIVAPWLLDGADMTAAVASVVAGVLLIGLSLPRGPVTQRYGGWDLRIV